MQLKSKYRWVGLSLIIMGEAVAFPPIDTPVPSESVDCSYVLRRLPNEEEPWNSETFSVNARFDSAAILQASEMAEIVRHHASAEFTIPTHLLLIQPYVVLSTRIPTQGEFPADGILRIQSLLDPTHRLSFPVSHEDFYDDQPILNRFTLPTRVPPSLITSTQELLTHLKPLYSQLGLAGSPLHLPSRPVDDRRVFLERRSPPELVRFEGWPKPATPIKITFDDWLTYLKRRGLKDSELFARAFQKWLSRIAVLDTEAPSDAYQLWFYQSKALIEGKSMARDHLMVEVNTIDEVYFQFILLGTSEGPP